MLKARRWTTPLTLEQFGRVTGAKEFPGLSRRIREGRRAAGASNGEFTYTLKGVHAKVSVTWEFEAPPGAGDTHFSVMRGTKASLMIKQGAEQGYKPVLYVERLDPGRRTQHEKALARGRRRSGEDLPGHRRAGAKAISFVVTVPEKYHNGHEAHFTQVTENFLKYLRAGKLPSGRCRTCSPSTPRSCRPTK